MEWELVRQTDRLIVQTDKDTDGEVNWQIDRWTRLSAYFWIFNNLLRNHFEKKSIWEVLSIFLKKRFANFSNLSVLDSQNETTFPGAKIFYQPVILSNGTKLFSIRRKELNPLGEVEVGIITRDSMLSASFSSKLVNRPNKLLCYITLRWKGMPGTNT